MDSNTKQKIKNFILTNSEKISSLSLDPDDFKQNLADLAKQLPFNEKVKFVWNWYLSYILASSPTSFTVKFEPSPIRTLRLVCPWTNGTYTTLLSFSNYMGDLTHAKRDIRNAFDWLNLTPETLDKVKKLLNDAGEVEITK